MDEDAVEAMKAEISAIQCRRQAAKLEEEKAAEHGEGQVGYPGPGTFF